MDNRAFIRLLGIIKSVKYGVHHKFTKRVGICGFSELHDYGKCIIFIVLL